MGSVANAQYPTAATNTPSSWTKSPAQVNTCQGKSKVLCAINLVYHLSNDIFPLVDYQTYGEVFLPVLQSAADTLDIINDYGPFSTSVHEEIENFVSILESKEDAINEMLTTPAHFDLARKLKSAIRQIKKETAN